AQLRRDGVAEDVRDVTHAGRNGGDAPIQEADALAVDEQVAEVRVAVDQCRGARVPTGGDGGRPLDVEAREAAERLRQAFAHAPQRLLHQARAEVAGAGAALGGRREVGREGGA